MKKKYEIKYYEHTKLEPEIIETDFDMSRFDLESKVYRCPGIDCMINSCPFNKYMPSCNILKVDSITLIEGPMKFLNTKEVINSFEKEIELKSDVFCVTTTQINCDVNSIKEEPMKEEVFQVGDIVKLESVANQDPKKPTH